jgi:hypothetical protein
VSNVRLITRTRTRINTHSNDTGVGMHTIVVKSRRVRNIHGEWRKWLKFTQRAEHLWILSTPQGSKAECEREEHATCRELGGGRHYCWIDRGISHTPPPLRMETIILSSTLRAWECVPLRTTTPTYMAAL